MRILVIDSDLGAREALTTHLTTHSFQIQAASDGKSGLSAAQKGRFDLILLEVALPHIDGFSLVHMLRQADDGTPVIFLTGRSAVEDRIHGLELGADDYITKPCSPGEIVARVKTVLRRASGRPPARASVAGLIQIGDLEMDLTRGRASRGGRRLALTPKEFSLLSLLARRWGEVLPRTFIAEEIWDTRFKKDTNVVDVHIRRLRAKLDDPFDQKMVVTMRGVGYMLTDGAMSPAEPAGALK